jgi:hypothetical protein
LRLAWQNNCAPENLGGRGSGGPEQSLPIWLTRHTRYDQMKTNKKNDTDGKIDTDLLNNALSSLLNPARLSPPAPNVLSQMPAGMLGYKDRKAAEQAQASLDRDATKLAAEPEARRQQFIASIKRAFPHIDVDFLAAQTKPWNVLEFKERVAQAQHSYLKERYSGFLRG